MYRAGFLARENRIAGMGDPSLGFQLHKEEPVEVDKGNILNYLHGHIFLPNIPINQKNHKSWHETHYREIKYIASKYLDSFLTILYIYYADNASGFFEAQLMSLDLVCHW